MSEMYPCPVCGAVRMVRTAENCVLEEGLVVKRLRDFKCQSCGARFFDDDGMHRIQTERANRVTARTV